MKLNAHLLNIFEDLENYSFEKFKGDMNAGIVTGIIAIPLSLALAIATGVDPVVGLYTAVAAGILASIFAGSRFSVSGPAAAMVPVLAVIIADYGIASLPLIGLLAGIFLTIFGLFKLGSFIKYVPLSVTLGFTAGIAVTLFFGQLNSFMGLSGIHGHEHFHEKVIETFSKMFTLSVPTFIIGLMGLAILIFLPKIKVFSKIPASLIAVIWGALLVAFLPGYFGEVKTIQDVYGAIPTGLPPIAFVYIPSLGEVFNLLVPALKVAFLISVESLLCAVVADKMTKTRHKSNKELIAQGIANIFAPMFGGIPSTAVIARTGTSIKNGARTRVAAFIHALVVLIFLLVLAPLGGQIPLAVLASILFITAWKISEQEEIRKLIRLAPKSDLAILFITFFLTVFTDLIVAVGVGMFISILFIFSRLSTIRGENITLKTHYANEEVKNMLRKNPDIQLINLEGNLSMGAAGSLKTRIKIRKDAQKIIFRLKEVLHYDLSGLEEFKELIEELKHEGKRVYLTSVNKNVSHKLVKFQITGIVDSVFRSSNEMVKRFA